MALRTLVVAAVFAVTSQAWAQGPTPQLPTALVEDVKSATANIQFMDYVRSGQVIKLEPSDVLVLSYLKSCEHETITGGTVTVGVERSDVRDGKIVRAKVRCDGGKMQLSSEQASASAASAFRLQNADIQLALYARTPVVQFPRDLANADRTLRIDRTDRQGENHTFPIDDAIAAAGYFDLSKANLSLTPGATYNATIGSHKLTFKIDANAESGPVPIVSRLLRFQ
jgi:hypothetical protein